MALSMRCNSLQASGRTSVKRAAVCVSGRRVCAPRSPLVQVRASSEVEAKPQQSLEQRFAQQIKDGRVINVSGPDAGQLQREGWIILDVRPPFEIAKVPVVGAVEVPLYVAETKTDVGSLMSQAAFMGTGGWWLGGTHMVANPNFIQEVQAKIPNKQANVVVACQKGLRSLFACEMLAKAGYTGGIAWINGGFDACRKGDLPTPNDVDLRYAGIGGLSEVLGWTEVQQAENKEKLGGFNGVLKIVTGILVADLLLFAYEAVEAYRTTGILPFVGPQ